MKGAFTLVLEGATYEGSVALLRGVDVVAERTLRAEDGGIPRAGRGERLMPAVAECMTESGVERADIARIVCGAGPGSFTSLRVAGSVAKGLAAGLGIDVYAVSSLLLTVSGLKPALDAGEYLSVLDAMRGEWYAAGVTVGADGGIAQSEPARIVTADELERLGSREAGLRVIGPGQQIDARPHARGAAPLLEALLDAGPVDLAGWEPDYGRLAEAQVRWEAQHGRPLVQ
jgi:universal bacterial protein YeaZ